MQGAVVPGAEAVLEARGLVKRYGAHVALVGLDLAVARGEIVCMLGANGAGKTTTIQLFLGFIEPSAGVVRVAGRDVSDDVVRARRAVAYIPENVHLYPHLSGLENLAFFTRLAGRPAPSRAELTAWLAEAGLDHDAHDRRVSLYSKGMRQKVGIAMALGKGAEALLLDEPMSGLDPSAAATFCELLQRMRERGVGVLMTTHDLFRAHDVGDRIVIMKRGHMVASAATRDLTLGTLESLYLEQIREHPAGTEKAGKGLEAVQ